MSGEGSLRLAFSTLTCPAWSMEQVVEAANSCGYQGVELRALGGEILDASMPPAERRRIKRLADDAGIAICCVDCSVRLASGGEPDVVARELFGFLELAREWESPLVRVFPGPWPSANTQDQVMDAMVAILDRTLPAAERLGVAVALETHDSFASAILVGELLARVPHHAFGALWDIYQPHLLGETPHQVFAALGHRILHVHFKDARRIGEMPNGWQLAPLGAGDLPVRAILDGLRHRGYDGWLSVEWPKLWHPELAEPEDVLPQHAEVLRGWLNASTNQEG
ncbi:MAG: sugar phosphate isomerase/epimerase family protein [Thermomicrobiales bacterium]